MKNYVLDYVNENEFRKLERALKKYNMRAFKKLNFEYYPALRDGNFSGEIISQNKKAETVTYELKLPSDVMFAQVHGEVKLIYTVYKKEETVMLKEITPKDYVEGPCMIKRGDKYFFLWSSGNWYQNDYCVYYGTAKSPIGPFEKEGVVVTSTEGVAKSPGHNGYFYLPEEDAYYIVYHRKAVEETNGHGRVLCIDKMQVSDDGIEQVSMT